MINNFSKQNFFAVWSDRTNPGKGFGCRWQQSIKCFKSLQIKKNTIMVFLVGLKGATRKTNLPNVQVCSQSREQLVAVWSDRTNPGKGFGCRWQQSIKCFKSLQIKKHHNGVFLVGLKGFEPLTFALEGHCSIQLSYKPKMNGAGEGNRTLATSLEGWGSTTELHPHIFSCF